MVRSEGRPVPSGRIVLGGDFPRVDRGQSISYRKSRKKLTKLGMQATNCIIYLIFARQASVMALWDRSGSEFARARVVVDAL